MAKLPIVLVGVSLHPDAARHLAEQAEVRPLTPDHPLLQLDNVVLTPHLGGSTNECDLTLAEDALRVLRGAEPLHPLG